MDTNSSSINKEGHLVKEPKISKKMIRKPGNYAKYLNIGFYLVTPLLAGVFLGLWLDSYFRTKPLFVVAGISIGAVSSLYNLVRLTREI